MLRQKKKKKWEKNEEEIKSWLFPFQLKARSMILHGNKFTGGTENAFQVALDQFFFSSSISLTAVDVVFECCMAEITCNIIM